MRILRGYNYPGYPVLGVFLMAAYTVHPDIPDSSNRDEVLAEQRPWKLGLSGWTR
jgi:hypothetical protein